MEDNMEESEENDSRPSLENREMHKAVCSECGAECEVPFKPTEGKPVRCDSCFKSMKSRRFNRFGNNNNRRSFRGNEPRQMHKAVCSECGAECEVPFKPREGNSVKCNDCFRKSRQ
jgi:CxxC-x17-CxxC domain-containing protein